MPVITCIEDLRQMHQQNAPKAFYDCVDAGSYTEGTYHANIADLAALTLRQRVLIERGTPQHRIGHARAEGDDASGAGTGGPDGHAMGRWRDPRRARRKNSACRSRSRP